MRSVPTVLNVGDIFAPSHKYTNSAAMVLDMCEWEDRETGDVEFGCHARLFADISVRNAYEMVSEFVSMNFGDSYNIVSVNRDLAMNISWYDAKQMIDILVEGQSWLVTTDSNGFVDATCFATFEEAENAWDAIDQAYMAWEGYEPCGVCKRYGHKAKEHMD